MTVLDAIRVLALREHPQPWTRQQRIYAAILAVYAGVLFALSPLTWFYWREVYCVRLWQIRQAVGELS